MPEDEYNPIPKIIEIAIALTELPASLSHSSKKTRKGQTIVLVN